MTTLALLFVNPLNVPDALRLWMFLPLALCVAVVYRATRARTAAELPVKTAVTFAGIVFGMVALALGAYVVSETFIHWL